MLIANLAQIALLVFSLNALLATCRDSQETDPESTASAGEQSAEKQTSYVEILEDTSFVGCSGKPSKSGWGPFGSRFARSPVLVSPDGRYRAYAEVEAAAPEVGGGCENTTKLFIAGPNTEDFKLIPLQQLSKWKGNGVRIVDWSPDGRLLLAELFFWIYESHGIGTDILVYDAQSSTSNTFDALSIRGLLAKYYGEQCPVGYKALGFSTGKSVVLEASPVESIYQELEATACLRQKSLWLLEKTRKKLSRLPEDFEAQRYGKWEEHKSKE